MANVRDDTAAHPAVAGAGSDAAAGEAARPARRARRPFAALLSFLAILGPGIIAATAGNDAGGIATYSQVGARYGYALLWMMVLITVSLALVQEMCARLGAATGKGLSDLIREQFGIRWTALIMLALLIANGATTISEFLGIAAALELFNIPRYVTVPIVAFGVWWLVSRGNYKHVEKVFLALALVFLAYPVAAYLAHPDWGEVARATITPTIRWEVGYLSTFIATVGTTITPYMQIYQQSAVVDKGVTMQNYGPARIDAIVGVLLSNLVAFFIIIACAATLYPQGIAVESAADAAIALEPFVGPAAKYLFATGLFGACVLAAGVLPLATAYSLSEAFGFEVGVTRSFRDAPIFYSIFTGLIGLGAVVAMIPGLPIIDLIVKVQVLNGLILPVILIAIINLINDRSLMGRHTNGPIYNLIAWATVVMVIGFSAALLGISLAQGLGLVPAD